MFPRARAKPLHDTLEVGDCQQLITGLCCFSDPVSARKGIPETFLYQNPMLRPPSSRLEDAVGVGGAAGVLLAKWPPLMSKMDSGRLPGCVLLRGWYGDGPQIGRPRAVLRL